MAKGKYPLRRYFNARNFRNLPVIKILIICIILILCYLITIPFRSQSKWNLTLKQSDNIPGYVHRSSIVVEEELSDDTTTIIRHRDGTNLPSLRYYYNRTIVITDYDQLPQLKDIPKYSRVDFFPVGFELTNPNKDLWSRVRTRYVFMPVEFPQDFNEVVREQMNSYMRFYPEKMVIVSFANRPTPQCYQHRVDSMRWSLTFRKIADADKCTFVTGSFAIVAKTTTLLKIPDPWQQPFPEALLLQAQAAGVQLHLVQKEVNAVAILPNSTQEGDVWPDRHLPQERLAMYDKFKIKKVVYDDRVEFYGCTRKTPRCFGTVYNDTPSYLRQGKWTPPCCLEVLRETARHVFKVLDRNKIRYWLEGGSLLGAMRSGDIIPWDYDVDIGAYRGDLSRSIWIRTLQQQLKKGEKFARITDDYGFVWETSRPEEGSFFRVQASEVNRLHVDIFPFYPKNGTMTKDTWMEGHPQDREFPEKFLKPLTRIKFVDTSASAPNHIREFLELKFGRFAIQQPRYPNAKMMPEQKLPIVISDKEVF